MQQALRHEHERVLMNVKLAVGGGLIVFLIGAIFWAGATYNRMGNIETAVGEIKVSLQALNQVPILEMRVKTLEEQLQQMKLDQREDEIKKYEGNGKVN